MEFDFQITQEIVAFIKDIFTAVAAVVASVVAIIGLHTWKKQLVGKTEHEVAMKLLRTLYELREAFAIVRSPFQSAGETYQAMKSLNIEGDPYQNSEIKARVQEVVYKARWENVQTAILNLRTNLLEAEALWGNDIKDSISPIFPLTSKLYVVIQNYLSGLVRQNHYDEKENMKQMSLLYGIPDDSKEDPFKKDVDIAIEKVEAFLRPKLKIQKKVKLHKRSN